MASLSWENPSFEKSLATSKKSDGWTHPGYESLGFGSHLSHQAFQETSAHFGKTDCCCRKRDRCFLSEPVKEMDPVAGWTILAYLPEIGSLNHKEAVRIGEVAPFNRDRRLLGKPMRIYGGRGKLRSVLYRATMVAIRNNRILKGFLKRLRHQIKPGKVTLVAVMRKRMVLANNLIENDKCMSKITSTINQTNTRLLKLESTENITGATM